MDEEEDDVPTCPLCLEELDATDRAVKACQCGYQVCLWCLHTIREQLNQRCPACRTPYEEQNFKIGDVDPEEAAKEVKERRTAKKERERREKLKEIERERERALLLSQQKAKSNLQHVRILQRNLVYIIGLSLSLAREEVIRRNDMFGKFGRMLRVLVNRSHPFHADAPGGPSISAYVQYHRDIDAGSAVRAMNNAVLDGREIRCAIATSKYCEAFVAGAQNCDISATAFYHCGNANCLYYHTTAQSDNILTREEVLARQLGPPPPSHLFLPVIPRRPAPPSINRAVNSQPTTPQPPSTSLATSSLNRPSVNPVSTSQPHFTISTFNSTAAPLQSATSAATLEHSQVPYSRQTTVTVSSGKSPPLSISSPREVEGPLPHTQSSLGSQAEGNGASASTQNPLTANPYTFHPSSMPLSFSGTSAPLPSSSTWASTQPGHPVSQFATKTTAPTTHNTFVVEGSVKRPSTQPDQHVCDVPPGFEAPGPVLASTSFPSKPPGFDAPLKPLTHRKEPLGTFSKVGTSLGDFEKNVSSEANELPPRIGLSPPPGFGSYPTQPADQSEIKDQTHAAEWLRKAHSDEVFSTHGRIASSFVGEIGSHGPVLRASISVDGANNSDDQSNNLQPMVGSIGGSLGATSELRNATISSSPYSHPDLALQGDSNKVLSDRDEANVQGMELDITSAFDERTSRQAEHSGSESIAASSSRRPIVFDSSETVRSAVTVAARRKHSRFVFARQGGFGTIRENRGLDCIAGGRSGSDGGDHSGLPPRLDARNSEPTDVRNVSKFSELLVSKKSAAGRNARSRFDFADRNYFSSNNVSPGGFQSIQTDHDLFGALGPQGNSSSLITDMKINGHNSSEPRDGFPGFDGSGTRASTGPPCQPVRWAFKTTQSAQPAPPLDPDEKHGLFFDMNSSQDATIQGNMVSLKGGGNDSCFRGLEGCSAIGQAQTSNIRNMRSLDGNRGTRLGSFYPPGFREATSGIPPDITAGENLSATGVASQMMSGGDKPVMVFGQSGSTHSEAPPAVHGVEEQASSGAETVEGDRKKIRTQKKRDRKRGGRDPTERKMVKKDLIARDSNQFGTKSFKDDLFDRGTVPGVVAQAPGEAESEDYDVSDNDVWQGQRTASDGGSRVVAVTETKGESERNVYESNDASSTTNDDKNTVRRDVSVDISNSATARHGHRAGDESGRYLSVSELEREVEAARAREAQLQDKLMEITRRLRSYDNVRS